MKPYNKIENHVEDRTNVENLLSEEKNIPLPGLWSLTENFIKSNPFLKYCIYYRTFYFYSAEELI
jgi:hypothetical protein